MFPHWVLPDVWQVLDKCWLGVSLQSSVLRLLSSTLHSAQLFSYSLYLVFVPTASLSSSLHTLSCNPLAQPILEATRLLGGGGGGGVKISISWEIRYFSCISLSKTIVSSHHLALESIS